ncbi:nucleoside ABC transporter ATP-binding protein [Thermaerobacter marianensis DSM 12885]|uniref:Nucleoside ABC transporter ATP-binding protein n=1 Tax=Thermaerobacter marianensis (strain ATCC 700841 / DSM 12885 / JCM 10246 / 7p75a) TaxID=644966 RepID=E6SM70_THEM7|nr:ABC transporter ATP-binding protein [Thermaerobacter marianensis]ADU51429.1 nucleoside ABC transporter ATP-binding protein [Thermaerobacter marianensis DSM 12885]
MADAEWMLEARHITKRFPGLVANDDVSFAVRRGEIHAVVGENGAGKSTLMKILAGLYEPDAGEIRLEGRPVRLRGPRHAAQLGIGMVHQHFMLVPRFTVIENVVLGSEPGSAGRLDLAAARARVEELARRYRLEVDPDARVADLSVGQQQRVEILKVLYRGAQVLILDEPTAVLVPQEVEQLFRHLEELRQQGKTVLFISHKLDEVLAIADRITVLRRGRVVGTVAARQATKAQLAEMMVGRPVLFRLDRPEPPALDDPAPLLALEEVTCLEGGRAVIDGVSLVVRPGEIYAIAGVEGNGQAELLQVVTGLRPVTRGRVRLFGEDAAAWSVARRRAAGMAVIPEDRHRQALVLPMTVWENAMLGSHRDPGWRRGPFYRLAALRRRVAAQIGRYDVRTPSLDVPVAALSGGNQQKLILARELERDPRLIVAAQPTRGLDVGAIEFVWSQLLAARARGLGVLLISADLEEILALADRIGVLARGRLVGELPRDEATPERLGRLMLAGGEPA